LYLYSQNEYLKHIWYSSISVLTVDYTMDTVVLKWITPKEKAVQFDPGGEDDSQFIIDDWNLYDCSYNTTDGMPPLILSFNAH
jgi:hypothetical protein